MSQIPPDMRPSTQGAAPPPPASRVNRFPVRALGKPDPEGYKEPGTSNLDGQLHDLMMRLMMDPLRFQNADPMSLEVLNQLRLYFIETSAILHVLLSRGLVSPMEMKRARLMIATAADEEFQRQMEQVVREQRQAPATGQTEPPKP